MRSGDGDHLRWEEESREKESSFGIFDVYRVTRTSPAGQRGSFVVVDAPDWVTVIPLVAGEEPSFLMVRQFRHGSRSLTLEFPAGVIEPAEEPSAAAARELAEETGFTADRITLLGAANPNPSFMCNTSYTFLAEGLHKSGNPTPDALELVEAVVLPVDRVVAQMGTGPFNNAIMMSGLAYYLRRRAARPGGGVQR